MRLSQLAAEVPGSAVLNGGEFEVQRVVQDSRLIRAGDLFVAIHGLRVDGHDFAAGAAAMGAAVAVDRPVQLPAGSPVIQLSDTRWGLGGLAAALYGWPARRLTVIGITGTAGKSTSTHMAAHVLESAGLPAGYLSTVANKAVGAASENGSGQTTMESPEVQAWLARMADEGAAVAVIEASSHALVQGRVAACEFDVAAFTNVGYDHLEYHGGQEAYLRAKARLIELCATAADKGLPKTAVLNRDDSSYEALAAIPVTRRVTYAIDREGEVRALDVMPLSGGTAFRLATAQGSAPVQLRLPARFNVSNALCAAACCLTLGLPLDQIARGLSTFEGVRGRLEPVDLGQPFDVYVDFAHSAVGLAGVLAELRRATTGRLLAVFGASPRSGGHDPAGMGRAAAREADFFVITTDDPVGVDPADLARQVESGIEGRSAGEGYEVVLDRRSAIRLALERAEPGDVVVLAGKGHERTLILAEGPVPWDERAEAEQALRELGLAHRLSRA